MTSGGNSMPLRSHKMVMLYSQVLKQFTWKSQMLHIKTKLNFVSGFPCMVYLCHFNVLNVTQKSQAGMDGV